MNAVNRSNNRPKPTTNTVVNVSATRDTGAKVINDLANAVRAQTPATANSKPPNVVNSSVKNMVRTSDLGTPAPVSTPNDTGNLNSNAANVRKNRAINRNAANGNAGSRNAASLNAANSNAASRNAANSNAATRNAANGNAGSRSLMNTRNNLSQRTNSMSRNTIATEVFSTAQPNQSRSMAPPPSLTRPNNDETVIEKSPYTNKSQSKGNDQNNRNSVVTMNMPVGPMLKPLKANVRSIKGKAAPVLMTVSVHRFPPIQNLFAPKATLTQKIQKLAERSTCHLRAGRRKMTLKSSDVALFIMLSIKKTVMQDFLARLYNPTLSLAMRSIHPSEEGLRVKITPSDKALKQSLASKTRS